MGRRKPRRSVPRGYPAILLSGRWEWGRIFRPKNWGRTLNLKKSNGSECNLFYLTQSILDIKLRMPRYAWILWSLKKSTRKFMTYKQAQLANFKPQKAFAPPLHSERTSVNPFRGCVRYEFIYRHPCVVRKNLDRYNVVIFPFLPSHLFCWLRSHPPCIFAYRLLDFYGQVVCKGCNNKFCFIGHLSSNLLQIRFDLANSLYIRRC